MLGGRDAASEGWRTGLTEGISLPIPRSVMQKHIPMPALEFPRDAAGARRALVQLLTKFIDEGLRPRVRVLLARTTPVEDWRSVFGRIDLARPDDLNASEISPTGNVRLAEEWPDPDYFLGNLMNAVGGGPFRVHEHFLADHGMNSRWSVSRRTHDWKNYAVDWPVLVAAPDDGVQQLPRLDGLIEATGSIPVFNDLEHLARSLSGFSGVGGYDHRIHKYQILIWDYRGRIETFDQGVIQVSPPHNPQLRLIGIFRDRHNVATSLVKEAPAVERYDNHTAIVSGRLELKINDEVLDVKRIDALEQQDSSLNRPKELIQPTPTSDEEVVYGSWEPIRALGKGGQGVAHLARHSQSHEQGALKTLHEDKWSTPEQKQKATARFRREVEITKSIRSSLVLRVIDANATADPPWVVTEYMPLGSLQTHLSAYRGDIWRTLRVARDIALALSILHKKELVHRDVKPSNILLRTLDHPVLGDFGIIHDPGGTELTETSERVGSAFYRPPEAEGGRFDEPPPNFDIYSLGKVIWSLLSGGANWFPREDFREEKYDLVSMLGRPELEVVNGLLDRMIVKEPGKRFETAEDVIVAIDDAISRIFGCKGAKEAGERNERGRVESLVSKGDRLR